MNCAVETRARLMDTPCYMFMGPFEQAHENVRRFEDILACNECLNIIVTLCILMDSSCWFDTIHFG